MWLDYVRERMPEKSIIELSEGFAIYYPYPAENAMYLEEIYVVPHWRKANIASDMLGKVEIQAKEMQFKYVLGSCDPSTKGATGSMKAMFKRGFELYKVHEGLIFLRKEIK